MEQGNYTKLFNPTLKVGLVSWREAWLFEDQYPEKLYTEVYKGKLVFRKRGSSLRISYERVKKGLIRRKIRISTAPLPF